MKGFSVTVDIAAPPRRVLALLLDVERWPEWAATVTSVRRVDGGEFGIGSKAHLHQPKMLPAVWQVTALSDTDFVWVTRRPGLQVHAGHAVEKTPTGSKVTLSLQLTGPLSGLAVCLFGRLGARYMHIEAESLRQRCGK